MENIALYVHDFHAKFGLAYYGEPRAFFGDELALRVKRQTEELNELMDAKTVKDAVDALIDYLYIAVGTLGLAGYHTAIGLEDKCKPAFDLGELSVAHQPLHDLNTKICNALNEQQLDGAYIALNQAIYYLSRVFYHSGIPALACFKEVHEANMRKERGNAHTSKYGNTYDIVKPAGFVAADVGKVLAAHGINPETPFTAVLFNLGDTNAAVH